MHLYATGKADYSNPRNWTLDHVPNTGETAVFGSGKSAVLDGLRQRTTVSVSIPGGETETADLVATPHDIQDGQTVRFRTTDTLPAAELDGSPITLSTSTTYHVVGVDRRGGTLRISTTADGIPIDFTDAGTGTHTLEVQLEALHQYSRSASPIGRPRRDQAGRFEIRPRYLQVGLLDPSAGAHNVEIGLGAGQGASRLHFDFGQSAAAVLVLNTGGGELPPLQLLTDSDETTVDLIDGELGIAIEPAESAKLGTLSVYGGRAVLGTVQLEQLRQYTPAVEFVRGSASGGLIQLSR